MKWWSWCYFELFQRSKLKQEGYWGEEFLSHILLKLKQMISLSNRSLQACIKFNFWHTQDRLPAPYKLRRLGELREGLHQILETTGSYSKLSNLKTVEQTWLSAVDYTVSSNITLFPLAQSKNLVQMEELIHHLSKKAATKHKAGSRAEEELLLLHQILFPENYFKVLGKLFTGKLWKRKMVGRTQTGGRTQSRQNLSPVSSWLA